jgi:hypothetical protein
LTVLTRRRSSSSTTIADAVEAPERPRPVTPLVVAARLPDRNRVDELEELAELEELDDEPRSGLGARVGVYLSDISVVSSRRRLIAVPTPWQPVPPGRPQPPLDWQFEGAA